MFRLIDSDHSESIDVQELHKILNQSETTKWMNVKNSNCNDYNNIKI